MKYGHPELLDRESLFRFFFWMKHTPPAKSGAFMSHAECSEVAWRQSVARAREYLNHVVQEIRWADRLNPFNHCPHFPFFMTHFTDSMPISSIGGIWSADLWNPEYASHVYKVTVAVDMLGNIVWICPLTPGTSVDVLIWDGYGPSRTRGDFFDFEVGGHDGAYKGRIHVIVPFIGRKNGTLTARQQGYNDVHGWYRARIEQLFARLWHWGLVRNIWRGGPNELHQSVRILLHFTQFCIRRQVRHPPYGPWEHVPPQVWTDQSNSAATQDEAEDEAEVCVLCCQRRSTVAVCDECKEHYCNECIDTHTVGPMLFVKYTTNDSWSG